MSSYIVILLSFVTLGIVILSMLIQSIGILCVSMLRSYVHNAENNVIMLSVFIMPNFILNTVTLSFIMPNVAKLSDAMLSAIW